MTSDQYAALCSRFVGATVRELRHIRDAPRAYIALPVVRAIAREQTRAPRAPTLRAADAA